VIALFLAGVLLGGSAAGAASGATYLTVDEALELAFPDCEIERRTLYLSAAEEARARELARVPLEARIVRPYVASCEGKLVGTAYFDNHRVRTKNEVLMFVVAPDGRLRRTELLSFAEPVEYVPRPAFYAQFQGRKLDDELALERGIRGVSGATLTARASTDAARRVLALHAVLQERDRKDAPGAGDR
jgi:hypothetical protein